MLEVDVLIETDTGGSRRERLRVEGAFTVGRTATNTLCLEGDLVSRTHVIIDLGASALRVEDRSSNGTMAGDVLPQVVDGNDHCWDAIRYALEPIIAKGRAGTGLLDWFAAEAGDHAAENLLVFVVRDDAGCNEAC